MKKKLFRVLVIVFLLIILIYATNITSLPDSIILFQGEDFNIGEIFGITLKEKKENNFSIEASSKVEDNNNVEKKKITAKLFNFINLKDIEVDTIPKTSVIPLGNSVGLKLYTSGVLVVGLTEIEGLKPYENTGIEEGDMIVEINNKKIASSSDLISTVNDSKGENLNIKYIRDGKEYVSTLAPVKTKEDEYKLGLWVRDRSSRNRNNIIL